MFRSRFFWRLYATYSVLVLVTAGSIGYLIQGQIVARVEAEVGTRLFAEAAALLPLAAAGFGSDNYAGLQDTIDAVARDTGSRITIVTVEGTVRVDSREDAARMENHAGRPELVDAFRDGTGSAQRFSQTVQMDMVYVARALEVEGGTVGAVRVAIPLAELDGELAAARRVVYGGAGLGIVLALGVGVFVARRFTAPVADMTRVSARLRAGEYAARVSVSGSGELAVLGDNLNRLADELTHQITHLASQGAHLNAIIRSMQDGVIAIDASDQVAIVNEAARTLLDLGPGDIDAEALLSLSPVGNLVADVRAAGEPIRREVAVAIGDSTRVLDVRGNGFATDRSIGVLLVLHDLTALRRLERIRTDFVANVSHELKTPLTSIRGYVETLLDGAVSDPHYNVRFLEKIDQHVYRLSALVTDLLSLARIESPEPQQAGPVDWRAIVLESIARRRDTIAGRHLDLRLELGDEAVTVIAEAEGAGQIVDNLLDNAINYTPESGRITVRVGTVDGTGVLEIADTGLGIPKEDLDRIFERFYRVDRGRSRALGGTGLGLSIVRNIVQRHRGSIDVTSEVGQGSRFVVRLPAAGS